MQLDYLGILKRAAEITWKYKFLWVLGILIALASGGGNSSNSTNYQFSGADTSQASSSFNNFMSAYLALVIFILVIVAILGFIIWILSIMANAGLIGAVAKIQRNEKTSLGDAFKIGARNFFRMLGVIILTGLLGFISFIELSLVISSLVVAIVGSSLMLSNNQTAVFGGFCLIPLAVVGVLLLIIMITGVVLKAIAIGVIEVYAFRFLVIKREKIVASIREAIKLIGARAQQTVVMYLLLFLVSFLAGIVFLIPGVLLFMLALPTLIAGVATKNIGIILMSVAAFFVMGLVMLFLNGLLQTYLSTGWTLTYMSLTGEQGGVRIPATTPAPPKPLPAESVSTEKPVKKPVAKKRAPRKKPKSPQI